ncbi:PfkB family carbohydrate kinase [Paenibacillus psychroresistens]|uniref:PfkB family carbohydrate kinase n=1 Tax=Paenibacillus psychroresistens TaxID=1778678 RepID=UPI001391B434|nr:PfkB family carbohydrate kinase [Paenibacillus psychroresistens]
MFHNFQELHKTIAVKLAQKLDDMALICDIIAVTDQLTIGVVGNIIRERLSYWADKGKIIVVDSRDRIGLFRNVIVKPNEIEAVRWIESEYDGAERTIEQWAEVAKELSQEVNGTCCVTLGSDGALWIDSETCILIPTRVVEPPIDIVGAGDGFAAALLCALGAGSDGPEATAFAHLAASIVIKKMGTTGTASPQEILAI